MQHCHYCDVQVQTPHHYCPLCAAPLAPPQGGKPAYPRVFNAKNYRLLLRIALAASVFCVAVCAVVNYLLPYAVVWWPIVASCLVWAWAVTLQGIRRGANGGGRVLMQVLAASLLCLALDYELGYAGWAVAYALPAICAIGTGAIWLLVLLNRTRWASYFLYQVAVIAIGFVPLLLGLLGFTRRLLPAVLVAILGAVSAVLLLVWGDASIKAECKRRLHF